MPYFCQFISTQWWQLEKIWPYRIDQYSKMILWLNVRILSTILTDIYHWSSFYPFISAKMTMKAFSRLWICACMYVLFLQDRQTKNNFPDKNIFVVHHFFGQKVFYENILWTKILFLPKNIWDKRKFTENYAMTQNFLRTFEIFGSIKNELQVKCLYLWFVSIVVVLVDEGI